MWPGGCKFTRSELYAIVKFRINTWKYKLHADSTTLCASKCRPSDAIVTSTRVWLCKNDEYTDTKLDWLSFQRIQNCGADIFVTYTIQSQKQCCISAAHDCTQQLGSSFHKLPGFWIPRKWYVIFIFSSENKPNEPNSPNWKQHT